MKKTTLAWLLPVLLTPAAIYAASTGYTANVIKTNRTPEPLTLSASSGAEGSSLEIARADHEHAVTGTLPVANGGTGTSSLSCSAGQAITSNGSALSCTSTLTASDLACSGCVSLSSEVSGTLPVGNGGTGVTTPHSDTVLVGNGFAWQAKTVPDCDTSSRALQFDQTSNNWSCNTSIDAATLDGSTWASPQHIGSTDPDHIDAKSMWAGPGRYDSGNATSVAVSGYANTSESGDAYGGMFLAQAGDTNVGVGGIGYSIQVTEQGIGVSGQGLGYGDVGGVIGSATSTSGRGYGGWFGLGSSANYPPTNLLTGAALVADNGTSTSPIFVALDNGSPAFVVGDGGGVVAYENLGVGGQAVITGSLQSLTDVQAPKLRSSDLSAGRVPYTTTGGWLETDSTLSYNATNGRMGIGTTSPAAGTGTTRLELVGANSGADTDLLLLRNSSTATGTAAVIKFTNTTTGASNLGSVELAAVRGTTGTGGSSSAGKLEVRTYTGSTMQTPVTIEPRGIEIASTATGNDTPGMLGRENLIQVTAAVNADTSGCSVARGFNAASCSRQGNGQYTLTFSNSLPNIDFQCNGNTHNSNPVLVTFGDRTTTSIRFYLRELSTGAYTTSNTSVYITCVGP